MVVRPAQIPQSFEGYTLSPEDVLAVYLGGESICYRCKCRFDQARALHRRLWHNGWLAFCFHCDYAHRIEVRLPLPEPFYLPMEPPQ